MNKKYCSELIWYSIGGCINSITSFILLLVVTRNIGVVAGGVFSIAYAAAQVFISIGKFGVRPYHSTDIKFQFSFGDYFSTRVVHIILMFLFFIIYLLGCGYDWKKNLIFIFILLIKGIEVLEDLYHGELQRRGYLDIAGKLLCIRSIGTIICWTLVMIISRDLFFTSLITAIVTVSGGVVINIVFSRNYFQMSISRYIYTTKKITNECFLIFIATFLSLYIYNFPKFVVERVLSDSDVTIYSILFMPTFVINMFSDFCFKPIMRKIATIWEDKESDKLLLIIRRQCFGIIIITLIFAIVMFVVGIKILELMYNVKIDFYHKELLILIIAGCGSAITYFFFNCLSAIRAQSLLITNYILGAFCVTITSVIFTRYFNIMGSALAFLLTEIVMSSLMAISAIIFIKRGAIHESGNNNFSKN